MALNVVRRRAALLAAALLVPVAGCTAHKATDGVASGSSTKSEAAYSLGTGPSGKATYAVVASSRAHGVTTYRLANSRTHAAALELFMADSTGSPYSEVIASGHKKRLAIARDGVVLRADGAAGLAEERAFLKSMLSPPPVRPLRSSATFTSILLGEHDNDADLANGKPSSVYKLVGMLHDGDDVELYLAVADDGRSVTFGEKDEDYRPSLTRFLSR